MIVNKQNCSGMGPTINRITSRTSRSGIIIKVVQAIAVVILWTRVLQVFELWLSYQIPPEVYKIYQTFTSRSFCQFSFAITMQTQILISENEKSALKMLVKLTPGVHFINVLQAAFTCTDSKSIKGTVKLSIFFTLLGSAIVKAARRLLAKLSPEVKRRMQNVLSSSNWEICSIRHSYKFQRSKYGTNE